MKETIGLESRKKARYPHNLFMLNLALVHLLMTPAVIALEIGLIGILLPLGISMGIMLFTYLESNHLKSQGDAYIIYHWKLALKRYHYLLISYALSTSMIALGWGLSLNSPDPNMQEILRTVFLRIAFMPVLLTVMVCFYLESSAINQTSKGIEPSKK